MIMGAFLTCNEKVGVRFPEGPPERTNMAINISKEDAKRCVGPGWSNLIDSIYDRLPEDAYIFQIKEKYGGLRFDVSSNESILDFIGEVENESLSICELCGDPGEPRETGWIKTLCNKHFDHFLLHGNLIDLDL